MTIDYFAIVVGAARQAADKVLGQHTSDLDHEQFEESRRRGEPDSDLCIVCQAAPHGEEDDTCGSRVCRETWLDELLERR